MAKLGWYIVTQIAFVWLSPLCALNAFSNRLAVNMHGHSCTICLVFNCILKLLAWTDANSHSLHLFTLHHHVFWNCSDISGAPCYHCNFGFICPSHLKYHMKRIATKEKVLSLFNSRLVRAWRCRALMWVFISIQIDPVIIFSQDFLLQLLLWLVSGHRPLLRLQMVSNEAYYTKEKSCTTWQDMFGHRLPQNRCSIMQNFAFFWRKFAHRCDLIYENDGTPKDSRAV